jgi:hypothetical protein
MTTFGFLLSVSFAQQLEYDIKDAKPIPKND